MKKLLAGLAFAVGFVAPSFAGTDAEQKTSAQEMVTVHKVDVAGKPPYKRQLIEVPVTDIAVMDVAEKDESKKAPRSRPPHNRHQY
jgi:hypothetical protein